MKKVTKVLLLICGICGGTGVVLLIVGMIMGVSSSQLRDSFRITDSDFWPFVNGTVGYAWEEDMEDTDSDKWDSHQFSEIRNLKVEVDAGLLKVETYNGQEIRVYLLSNDRQTTVNQNGHTLEVSLDSGSWFRKRGKPIKILIPKDQVFNEVDIEVGAGEGIIDGIRGKKVEAEVGVGELTVNGLITAEKSKWSVGAGSLQIEHLQSEKTEMECKAGEIDAVMDGKESNYQLEAKVDVGNLEFGGSSWDSLGQKVHMGDSSADNKIEVDCSIGDVNIDFTE